jgi:hypothetical protein
MINFIKKITLFNEDVVIKEYTLKEYKTLLKKLLSIKKSPLETFNFLKDFLVEKTNLETNKINSLDFIDFFLLLFHIRCTSSANIIKAETVVNEKKVNLKLNINDFILFLSSIDKTQILIPENIEKTTTIYYTLPTILDIFNSDDTTILYYFIDSIKVNERVFEFKNHSLEERKILYSKLPLKIVHNIKKRVYSIIDFFNNCNLIDDITAFYNVKLLFNFEKENLILILRLLFEENLLTIYENQLLLAKYGNMLATYTDECTPGEYNIFIELLNKDLKGKDDKKEITFNPQIKSKGKDIEPTNFS